MNDSETIHVFILQRFYSLAEDNRTPAFVTIHQCKTGFRITFQSRFGRAKWLEPATDNVLADLGRTGKSVAIFAPGFAADCLETLEELAIRGKQQFADAGGGHFAYLPCLNAEAPGVAMIEALVRRELAGWL